MSAVTYLIRCRETRLFKIGRSTRSNLGGRMDQMKTGSAGEHELICVIDGDHESVLHARYAHLRKKGEWFALDTISLTEVRNFSRSGSCFVVGSPNDTMPMPDEMQQLSAWAGDLSLSHAPDVVAAVISGYCQTQAAQLVASSIQSIAYGRDEPGGLEALAMAIAGRDPARRSLADAISEAADGAACTIGRALESNRGKR